METIFLIKKYFHFGSKIIKTKKDFYLGTRFLNLKLTFLIIHSLFSFKKAMTLLAHRKIPQFIFKKKTTCSNLLRVHRNTLFFRKKYEEGKEDPECENALLFEQHL